MRPSGLQANDARPRDMSPSPISPTCLEQQLSAGAERDVRREESSSNRSAKVKTEGVRDIAGVQFADSVAKRVEFTADPDEVIEIRATGKNRSLKNGITPQCQRMVKSTEVSKPQQSEGAKSEDALKQKVLQKSGENFEKMSQARSKFSIFSRGKLRQNPTVVTRPEGHQAESKDEQDLNVSGKSYGGSRPNKLRNSDEHALKHR